MMKTWKLDLSKFAADKENQHLLSTDCTQLPEELVIKNTESTPVKLCYENDILIVNEKYKSLQISFVGTNLKNSGGCLYINGHPVTLNGFSNMEITPPINLHITMMIPSDSAIKVTDISLMACEEIKDLTEDCSTSQDVLVITPDYPSTHNLYLCAFAHSRNREYIKAGLNVQVATISPNNWYQSVYELDGVPVFSGRYLDLKKLLSRHQYKVIVVHFVDEKLYPIFDGYIHDERLIFICHGPETTFRFLTNRCRPYFTKELPEIDNSTYFDKKETYAIKYAQKENVDWVFVSEWLRDFSEKMLGTQFKNSHIIYNTINENLFPYAPKTADDRKKILILRKFDNIRVHSIDQIVNAIRDLSRRDFFDDLTFEVYGDGNYYYTLVEPLRGYSNVHLHQTFIPNEKVYELHKNNGILLIPSRHDSQGVAMCEAASSGLVVVGSRLDTTSFFMNQQYNHTLADPEDPHALADIIERLYNNPDEYLEISARMSAETQALCNRTNTVLKEVALINRNLENFNNTNYKLDVYPNASPILTIVIPAYNVESYLEKCIRSLLAHRNVAKTEIIIVNDGSKDRTSEIAHHFEKISNGIVKVIDKENGGHGSTINVGLANARGRYFRLIDGDDWVDAENLAILVDKLEYEVVDVVLTKGSYEYVEQAELTNIIDYDMLNEGTTYYFEDLLYPGYGFSTYGPLLTTGNYRTEVLKKAKFHISEKRPYVDMEFNSFALRYVETLKYYDLDIYRYLIGREGQTVSRDFWKKKYKDHKYVILNILNTVQNMNDYSDSKKKYVYEHITAMMIDSQIFMYDQLCLWEEIDEFISELKKWPDALQASLNYIKQKNGDCSVILEKYKLRMRLQTENRKPIIGSSISENSTSKHSWKWYMKKAIKACTPYGILRLYQLKRYPNIR